MNTQKEHGFNTLLIVLAIVIAGAMGLIIWRMLDTKQPAKNTDISSPQQTAPKTPANPNEGYVVIKEWGVRFKPADGLEGLQYFTPAKLTANEITFTTTALAEASEGCRATSGHILLGLLSRSTSPNPQDGLSLAKIGDYTYQYRGPQAACTKDDAGLEMENQTLRLLDQSLETLEIAE